MQVWLKARWVTAQSQLWSPATSAHAIIHAYILYALILFSSAYLQRLCNKLYEHDFNFRVKYTHKSYDTASVNNIMECMFCRDRISSFESWPHWGHLFTLQGNCTMIEFQALKFGHIQATCSWPKKTAPWLNFRLWKLATFRPPVHVPRKLHHLNSIQKTGLQVSMTEESHWTAVLHFSTGPTVLHF